MYGRGNTTVRFGPPVTPDVIKYLLIANVAVLVLENLLPRPLVWSLSVVPEQFWTQGHLWQPVTYMWLHAPNSLSHIGFNMLALWMFGSPLATIWGERRFLRYYLLCGIGAGLVIALAPLLPALVGLPLPAAFYKPTLGASGAVFGVLLAYSLTWPDRTIMLLFPPIPLKAIYFIPFILGVEILIVQNPGVSSIGHLGGVLVGWLLFRRGSGAPLLPSLGQLRYRVRRWRMRRKLRSVRVDEDRWRRDDDWRVH